MMDLPTELRLVIWEHLLISATPFELMIDSREHFVQRPQWQKFKDTRSCLGILRLNKTIRNESTEIFYEKNEPLLGTRWLGDSSRILVDYHPFQCQVSAQTHGQHPFRRH